MVNDSIRYRKQSTYIEVGETATGVKPPVGSCVAT
jgi:hypothetical protein